jgi:hypothetical protein
MLESDEGADAAAIGSTMRGLGLMKANARIRPGMTSHEAARVFEISIERSSYGSFMVTRPAYSIGASFPPGWGEDNVTSIRAGNDGSLLVMISIKPAISVISSARRAWSCASALAAFLWSRLSKPWALRSPSCATINALAAVL